MEALPRDGTNDQFADDDDDDDQFVDDDGIVDLCTDETGFYDCLDAALFFGEVTDDEVDAAFDAISGFEDDGWSADTCAEFQPNVADCVVIKFRAPHPSPRRCLRDRVTQLTG